MHTSACYNTLAVFHADLYNSRFSILNYTLFANIIILNNVFLQSLKVETDCEIYYLHSRFHTTGSGDRFEINGERAIEQVQWEQTWLTQVSVRIKARGVRVWICSVRSGHCVCWRSSRSRDVIVPRKHSGRLAYHVTS